MKAYISLLSTDSYARGILAVNNALIKVGAKYPFYCALSLGVSDVIESKLTSCGVHCVRLKERLVTSSLLQNGHAPHWSNSFDKLQLWGLTQFDKLVYIDSDMFILRNLDSLFDCPAFSGVCAGKSFPGNERWCGINSGLMVIEPDLECLAELVRLVPIVVDDFSKRMIPVGDQDVIQRFLTQSWDENMTLQLNEGYNVLADYLTFYVRKLGYSMRQDSKNQISIIHFIGHYKPWMKPNAKELVWLIIMFIKNPLYWIAFMKYLRVLAK